LADFLILPRFSEDVKVLVGYKQKVVLAPPPLSRRLHLPLQFYDIFTKDETDIQEGLQNPWSNWDEVLVPPGVAYEDGAVLAGFS
jgi:hypothetical protein